MLLKRWIPAAVLVATFFLSVVIWQALVRSERAALSNHTDSTASVAREFLRDELESHAESLSDLGKRWQLNEGPAQAVWMEDAALLLQSKPEFAAIVWAGNTREVFSSIPSKAALPVDFAIDKAVAVIFASASQTWSPVVSPPVKLTSGRTGFIIAVPLWYAGEFKGLIAGIFDSREFITTVLNDDRHELDGYAFAITSGKAELYRSAPAPESALAIELPVDAAGSGWKISVWPGRELAGTYLTALPTAVFALGSVSSLLFATLIYFAQVNRQKNTDLENANEMLKELEKIDSSMSLSPIGTAAAAIYLASLAHGERRPQKAIAKVAGVSEVTLRNRFQFMEDFMQQVVMPRGRAPKPSAPPVAGR